KQLQTLEDTVDNVKIQLVHFLAKRKGEVKPGPTVCEWAWHDINNLPDDCAANVVEIISKLTK
ncbi:MAG: hypothetical protein ABH832_01580, partial [bacterium]